MRATVKVRSLATLCSFDEPPDHRQLGQRPDARDAVRFTAALATPDLNCPPVAVNDTASITENAVPDRRQPASPTTLIPTATR